MNKHHVAAYGLFYCHKCKKTIKKPVVINFALYKTWWNAEAASYYHHHGNIAYVLERIP